MMRSNFIFIVLTEFTLIYHPRAKNVHVYESGRLSLDEKPKINKRLTEQKLGKMVKRTKYFLKDFYLLKSNSDKSESRKTKDSISLKTIWKLFVIMMSLILKSNGSTLQTKTTNGKVLNTACSQDGEKHCKSKGEPNFGYTH